MTASSQKKTNPAPTKGKDKVEGWAETPIQPVEEVYNRRAEILPYSHDTLFTELGHKGMVARYHRATKNIISEVDMDYLDTVHSRERIGELQSSAAEVWIRHF